MTGEADRLDQAARVLSEAAFQLDESVRRLSTRVEAEVVYSNLGWKGPAADQFWRATQDRMTRMRRARDRMHTLSEQMHRQATIAREEERQRRLAGQSGGA
jgi:hypothetical protein